MPKTLVFLLTVLLVVFSAIPTLNGHNITSILARYPQFSSFNHHLTTTGLAEEINHQMTLTVCVVDNPTMRRYVAKWRPSTTTLRHVLSLHVLLNYYGSRKLHHLPSSTTEYTLFEENNHVVFGYPRFVHITSLRGGKVIRFSAEDKRNRGSTAYFVKSVKEVPYNISVIQISSILSPPRASRDLRDVLTIVMSNNLCNLFREKLSGTEAEKIYGESLAGGLTIFCPADYAFSNFLPRFEKLSETDKNALLMYHALPIYQSIYMLRSNNGLANTLATEGPGRFQMEIQNGRDAVVLKTKDITTRIVGRLLDDLPLAIYAVDDVLLPKELFKA